MRTIRTKIKKATSTPKGRIIFYSILLLVVLGITGGLLYWSFYKKQIIRQTLESTIRQKSKGLYQIVYDKLDVDEVAGFLSVNGLRLTFDSTRYAGMKGSGNEPPTLLRINIPVLTVSGVKTPRALIDKEIVGRKVEIRSPVIDIFYTNAGKDSSRSTPSREVYEQILGDLNLIQIDTVLITQATITTRELGTGKTVVQLSNADVELIQVSVDSASEADPSRILFSKSVNVGCEKLRWSDNRYEYGIDSIAVSSVAEQVTLKKFFINPLLDEAAFTRKLRFADDRFDATINDIDIRPVSFRDLFNERLITDTVDIRSVNLKIYRDLGLPHDGKKRIGTYPNQALEKLGLPLLIKAVRVGSSFIEYKERNQKTRQSGKVQFFNTSALLTNVTNRKELAGENSIMTVDARTTFLNKAPLRATWKFHLFNPNGRFDLRGSLGQMNAPDVNVLSEPMGPARIEKGTINSLSFDLAATNYNMRGKIKMLYDDLKVSILEKDEETKDLKKKKLASFAANIVIKNANPAKKNDEPRVAEVSFDRDIRRSLFHMTWKTLFKGIKETAGIKK